MNMALQILGGIYFTIPSFIEMELYIAKYFLNVSTAFWFYGHQDLQEPALKSRDFMALQKSMFWMFLQIVRPDRSALLTAV